jgi:hypothetical protein
VPVIDHNCGHLARGQAERVRERLNRRPLDQPREPDEEAGRSGSGVYLVRDSAPSAVRWPATFFCPTGQSASSATNQPKRLPAGSLFGGELGA